MKFVPGVGDAADVVGDDGNVGVHDVADAEDDGTDERDQADAVQLVGLKEGAFG